MVLILEVKLCKIKNYLKNQINQVFENLKNENYTHLLKTIFGLLIFQICNQQVYLTKSVFLLCTIDIYSKYVWVVLLKDKKDITITNAFQKNELRRKPNKICVDTGSEY